MKKLLILMLLLVSYNLFAQNFSFDGEYYPDLYSTIDYLVLNGNSISYQYETYEQNDKEEEITVSYKKIYKEGLLFLQMAKVFPRSILKYHNEAPKSRPCKIFCVNG